MKRSSAYKMSRLGVSVGVSILAIFGVVMSSASSAFAVGEGASATPVILNGTPVSPGVANCPGGPFNVGSGGGTVAGVTLTTEAGSCTLESATSSDGELAKATVGNARFGANQVSSITSMCDVDKGLATSSAVYLGQTISGPLTVTTPDGYILMFNITATNGTLSGRTALQITTPAGDVLRLATVLCQGIYPLAVSAAHTNANASLGNQQSAGFTHNNAGSNGGSFPSVLILGLAVCAFFGVNVVGVRWFRRRQQLGS